MDPLDALLRLPRFGHGVGLHRVQGMLAPLELSALDALKVTGSNGKGSAALVLGALLQAVGLKSGGFTSPHLLRLNERFTLDGEPAPDALLQPALGWALAQRARWEAAWPGDAVARFECLTAAAMRLFTEAAPDAVILEAGIGGRLDPTRVPPGQVVGLTSVDLEHAALLGPTRELIALDKAALCPPGGVLVCGPLGGLSRRLDAHCALRGVERVDARQACQLGAVEVHATHARFEVQLGGRRVRLRLGLPGAHQVDNACVALVMAWRWLGRHHPGRRALLLERLPEALAALRHPGRATWLSEDPPVLADAAHTPRATQALAALLAQACPGPLHLVLGASEGRALGPLFAPLWPLAAGVYAYQPRHRGGPAEDVAALARAQGLPAEDCGVAERALAEATRAATQRGGSVALAGSLFGVAEVLAHRAGLDPAGLRFL